MGIKGRIINILKTNNKLTDRELTDIIKDYGKPQQHINQVCRILEKEGVIIRRNIKGKIRNIVMDNDFSFEQVNEKEIEITNNSLHETNSKNVIKIEDYAFTKLDLEFQYFDRENIFSGLTKKTLLDTIDNNRYKKLKDIVQDYYQTYYEYGIGEFIEILKNKNDYNYKLFLNKYGDFKFCKFHIKKCDELDNRGIYLYKYCDEIVYIGRCCDSFRRRLNQGYGKISPKNCYLDGQSTNCHINNLVNETKGNIEIFIYQMDDKSEIIQLEKQLIQKYKPMWNIKMG